MNVDVKNSNLLKVSLSSVSHIMNTCISLFIFFITVNHLLLTFKITYKYFVLFFTSILRLSGCANRLFYIQKNVHHKWLTCHFGQYKNTEIHNRMLIGDSPYRQVTFVSILLDGTLLTVISQFLILVAHIINFFTVIMANKAYVVKDIDNADITSQTNQSTLLFFKLNISLYTLLFSRWKWNK